MHRRQLLIGGASLMALVRMRQRRRPARPVSSPPRPRRRGRGGAHRPRRPARPDAAAPSCCSPGPAPMKACRRGTRMTARQAARAAMLEGIELQRADIAAIANNPEAPTFANTIVALELAGEPLDRAVEPLRRHDLQHRRRRLRRDGHRGVAPAVRRRRRDHLQRATVPAHQGGRRRRRRRGPERPAEASGRTPPRRLRPLGRQSERRRQGRAGPDQHRPVQRLHRLRPEGRRRREHLDGHPDRGRRRRPARPRTRPPPPPRPSRATPGLGHRQHPLERRSVPDLRRRPRRCARRSGASSRTAATTATPTTPTRPSPRSSACATSAPSCWAIATTPHWRMQDTMAKTPAARHGADEPRLGRRPRRASPRRSPT